MTEKHYIQLLIEQGEHQRLDFKFAVNDSKKIARSLSAFANTHGGTLLIGVKDNGNITGVSSDEEFYMVQSASQLHTKPEVFFETKKHNISGKTVLEIIVPESKEKPHSAPDYKGFMKAFVRVKDENRLADSVIVKVWKNEKQKSGVKIFYTEAEKFLLNYLEENDFISFREYARKAKISRFKAEKILVNFILLDIVKYDFNESSIIYKLKKTD